MVDAERLILLAAAATVCAINRARSDWQRRTWRGEVALQRAGGRPTLRIHEPNKMLETGWRTRKDSNFQPPDS